MTDNSHTTASNPGNNNPDMNALGRLVPITMVKIGAGSVFTCNARELHAYLEVRKDFSTWIKGRIAKYEFKDGVDYVIEEVLSSPNLGSAKARVQRAIEYHLTLDMAKELAMVENNPMGRQARQYFIACEKQAVSARGIGHETTQIRPEWTAWNSLSTDERRTRQRDALIYRQSYGAAGMRFAMHQNGMPTLPAWAVGAQEARELDLTRQGSLALSGASEIH